MNISSHQVCFLLFANVFFLLTGLKHVFYSRCFPPCMGSSSVLHTQHRAVSYSDLKKKKKFPSAHLRICVHLCRNRWERVICNDNENPCYWASHLCSTLPCAAEMILSALNKRVLFDNHTAYLALSHSHLSCTAPWIELKEVHLSPQSNIR